MATAFRRGSACGCRHSPQGAFMLISYITGLCALGIALGLKAFYSRAGAGELLWILAPSAWLARFVGGIDLVYEQGAGFISHSHRLVVGSACAGVNFLIICFLCLYFSFARQPRRLAVSLAISFIATVLANGLRIFVSAHLWDADIYGQWITREAKIGRASCREREES